MANLISSPIADGEFQVSTAIGVGTTSFSLSSATDDDGVALPAGIYTFTVDNGSTSKEFLIGQLNGVNVTGVSSVSRQGVLTSGAKRAHRVGASAIITDFSTILTIANILKGTSTLDGASPISYDVTPTLTDGKQLATVAYVLSIVTGGTVNFDNQTISGVNGGENIVLGNLIYLNTADQEWYLSDADTSATVNGVVMGIAKGTGSNGVAITGGVHLSGVFTTSGLTAGSLYYAGNTAGAISTSVGTISRLIGVALSTTRLFFFSTDPRSISSSEKDFLGSTTGMISMYAGAAAPTGFLLCDGAAVSRTTFAALFAVASTTYGVGDGAITFNVPDLRARLPIGAGAGTFTLNFASTDVVVATDTITVPTNTSLYDGTLVRLTTTGTLPTGLALATDYFVVRVSATTIRLATTIANALAATPVVIDITAQGSGTNTVTVTLTNRAIGARGGEETHPLTIAELASHKHDGVASTTNPTDTLGNTNNEYSTGSTNPTGGNTPHNVMNPFVVINYIIKT